MPILPFGASHLCRSLYHGGPIPFVAQGRPPWSLISSFGASYRWGPIPFIAHLTIWCWPPLSLTSPCGASQFGRPSRHLYYNILAQCFLFPFLFLNECNLCTIRSCGSSTSLLYVRLITTHLESPVSHPKSLLSPFLVQSLAIISHVPT